MSDMTHLDELEAEAIYIMREVVAECEKPVMLYSIGKDSSSIKGFLSRKATVSIFTCKHYMEV